MEFWQIYDKYDSLKNYAGNRFNGDLLAFQISALLIFKQPKYNLEKKIQHTSKMATVIDLEVNTLN